MRQEVIELVCDLLVKLEEFGKSILDEITIPNLITLQQNVLKCIEIIVENDFSVDKVDAEDEKFWITRIRSHLYSYNAGIANTMQQMTRHFDIQERLEPKYVDYKEVMRYGIKQSISTTKQFRQFYKNKLIMEEI